VLDSDWRAEAETVDATVAEAVGIGDAETVDSTVAEAVGRVEAESILGVTVADGAAVAELSTLNDTGGVSVAAGLGEYRLVGVVVVRGEMDAATELLNVGTEVPVGLLAGVSDTCGELEIEAVAVAELVDVEVSEPVLELLGVAETDTDADADPASEFEAYAVADP
jgi:hypothetical protein